MQNMDWKLAILVKFSGKIENVSTHNFICQKFAVVLSGNCPAYFFLTHNATTVDWLKQTMNTLWITYMVCVSDLQTVSGVLEFLR